MIIKVCQFKARREQGEKLVQIFEPGDMEKAAGFFGHTKTAAPLLPQVKDYLEGLKRQPNKIYILVNALGAGEFWGSNINGDYFPEPSLIHTGPTHGYKTFYNAHAYSHHVNKDPSKSFGDVELACWHSDMKRVELVIAIDRMRARQFGAESVIDKLDHGQFPDVSMGCKVPYDICSVCTDWKKYRQAQATFDPSRHISVGRAVLEFHKKNPIRGVSVTRDDYCEHLKTMLNKILKDGRKVYAINDYPRFFDISFVFIGADKTAKVMMKLAMAYPECGGGIVVPSWYVAEQMGYEQPAMEKEFEKAASIRFIAQIAKKVGPNKPINLAKRVVPDKKEKEGVSSVRAKLREKRASHRKGAEIIKEIVPSQFGSKAVPLEQTETDLPNEVLDRLGQGDLSKALSTPSSMGIMLKPREFQRITIIRLGKKPLADKLDEDGKVFSPTQDIDHSVPVGTEHFSDSIKKLLLPFLGGRSMLEPPVKRRMVIKIFVQPKPEPEEVENDELLSKVAAAYNSYLDHALTCLMDSQQVVDNNPDLWEAVHHVGVGDGLTKAAAGVNPWVVLGGAGAGLAVSRYALWQRRRAMMGDRRPVGPITDVAADFPKSMMALGGLAALQQQGMPVVQTVGRVSKGVGKALSRGRLG